MLQTGQFIVGNNSQAGTDVVDIQAFEELICFEQKRSSFLRCCTHVRRRCRCSAGDLYWRHTFSVWKIPTSYELTGKNGSPGLGIFMADIHLE